MTFNKNKLLTATIFACVFMGTFSISVNMYGTIMPQLVNFFNISLLEVSTLNIINDFSQAGIMIFMLFVADKLDKGKLLTLSAICYGLTLFLVGNAPSYYILLALRVCMGVFGGLVNNLCTVYVSDLYGDGRSKYIAILHTLFAVGSLIGPIFAASCIEFYSWQLSYISLGITIFATGLLFLIITKTSGNPENKTEINLKKEKLQIPYKEIIKNKNVHALCLGNFLLASTTFFMLWLPTYLGLYDGEFYTVEITTILLTATSFGMIISRTLLGILSPRFFTANSYLKWASLLTTILLTGMLLIQGYIVWLVGIFIFGVISGATFTANIILACKEYPKFSATITAITGTFSMIGSMSLNAVVASLGDIGYYNEAMFIPVGMTFIAFFVYSFMYKEKNSI